MSDSSVSVDPGGSPPSVAGRSHTPGDRLTEDTAGLLARLRAHPVMSDAPDEELEWIAERGELRGIEPALIYAPGDRVNYLFIVLSGHIEHHVERAHGRRKVAEWRGGDVTGFLPYSRMTSAGGLTRTVEPTEAILLHRDAVAELPIACPHVTATLVHVMTDRARTFTSADLQDRKALALGKVAAGLAHELNNPASALIRSAKTLVETLDAIQSSPAGGGPLSPEAVAAADRLYALCRERGPASWDAVERADREQAIEEWLDAAGQDSAVAGALADSPLALDELFGLADTLDTPGAVAAVCRMARSMTAVRLADEIEDGASRVYHLVNAVKRFTHMDQPMVLGPVQVNEGLADAVALLAERARAAGVAIELELAEGLPAVVGVVEELNETWHNLLSNAVDAAAPDGTVRVTSAVAGERVVVVVEDDGPGIPEEVRDRIFDPFFTTKPIGSGVGLGLEVVRRVVSQHRGEVDVTTEPGRTVFRVTLPVRTSG